MDPIVSEIGSNWPHASAFKKTGPSCGVPQGVHRRERTARGGPCALDRPRGQPVISISPFVCSASTVSRPSGHDLYLGKKITDSRHQRPCLAADIEVPKPGAVALDVEREPGTRGVAGPCAWPATGLPKRKQGFRGTHILRAFKSPPLPRSASVSESSIKSLRNSHTFQPHIHLP